MTWAIRKKKRRAKLVEDQFGKRAHYVRGFPCIVERCDRWPTQAAHVKSRATGGLAENNLVPLCVVHHTEQHASGMSAFQAKHRIDLREEAERIEGLFLRAYTNLGDNDLAF